jgi:ATP-dependent Clp protease ATP-binding subunit ClpA
MAPAPPLTDLIAAVDAETERGDPLAHLAAATVMAGELAETSDALVGHFVDRCRAAGHTWAEISVALGVSRQAAHKRYSTIPRDLGRWTERAKRVLTASIDAARGLGHGFVGTEHLLLGLFPPGGIGATLLAESGLTEEAVARAVVARTPANDVGPAEPPFTPLAAQVFGGALSEAVSMGHNYIGTEHLLLALSGQPEGLAAEILAEAGIPHAALRGRVIEILAGFTK